jgi:prepilin-type N-terminal cleavage/methylation domain-containing protein
MEAAMRRHGYTLIEVLLVVVILGISAAVLIPSLGDANVLRVQAAVRTVVSDITFAQTDALGYQQRRAIIFDTENNSYSVNEVQITGGGGASPTVLYEPLFLPVGANGRYIVDLDVAGFDGSEIYSVEFDGVPILIFDELGTPVIGGASDVAGSGGSIYVRGAGSAFRIDVAPYTAKVTVERVAFEPEVEE